MSASNARTLRPSAHGPESTAALDALRAKLQARLDAMPEPPADQTADRPGEEFVEDVECDRNPSWRYA